MMHLLQSSSPNTQRTPDYTSHPANATAGANTAHLTHGSANTPAPDAVCSAGALEAVPEGTTVLNLTVDGPDTEGAAAEVVGPLAGV
jgi:hypothetical protein